MENKTIKLLPEYSAWQIWIFEMESQAHELANIILYKYMTKKQREAIRKLINYDTKKL